MKVYFHYISVLGQEILVVVAVTVGLQLLGANIQRVDD